MTLFERCWTTAALFFAIAAIAVSLYMAITGEATKTSSLPEITITAVENTSATIQAECVDETVYIRYRSTDGGEWRTATLDTDRWGCEAGATP